MSTNNQNRQQDVAGKLPYIESKNLFGNARQVSILHEGETYTLSITSRGKLILTK
ncbi:MAG: hemin uptake protein HemP [Pseudomonadaceae bacterium]|nr:hemin uptake protein HemP [Pseudomonadaceae bacterium]